MPKSLIRAKRLSSPGASERARINIGIDGKYATWAGTMLKRDRPIVVIADDERVEESILRLGRIGFDHVNGYLQGGMDALRDRSDLLATVQRITAPALGEDEGDVHVVDVRTANEWGAGHIEGSLNIPLNQLEGRLDEVPTTGTVVVLCQSGYRSSLAVSLLQQRGYRRTSWT